MLEAFLSDEGGAVTVDWVVLTGGLVGLGLATLAVVSGGVESLSGGIGSALSNQEISSRFATLASLLSTGFSGESGGFSGGQLVNLAGFGEVLQLGPGMLATTLVSIPSGATSATITFDLHGVDDLSGAPATIFINGQAVAIYADNHGTITTSDLSGSDITVELDQHFTNDPYGAGTHGHDSSATYTITVANPGDTLEFGVASGSGEPTSDEFYAIDDVEITSQ